MSVSAAKTLQLGRAAKHSAAAVRYCRAGVTADTRKIRGVTGVDTTGGGHRWVCRRGRQRQAEQELQTRGNAQCLPAVYRDNMECHPTAALLLLLLLLLLHTANAEGFLSPS